MSISLLSISFWTKYQSMFFRKDYTLVKCVEKPLGVTYEEVSIQCVAVQTVKDLSSPLNLA
jgi:hypothetical protein